METIEDHKIQKLPVWARDLILMQRREIDYMKKTLGQHAGTEPSRVSYSNNASLSNGTLPDQSRVYFEIESRADTGKEDLQIRCRIKENALEVSADTSLQIEPISGNVIHISLKTPKDTPTT